MEALRGIRTVVFHKLQQQLHIEAITASVIVFLSCRRGNEKPLNLKSLF